MLAAFLLVLILQIALYIISKNRYNDFIEPLDKKQYQLKQLIPMGLFILDSIRYKFSTKYDRKLLRKISDVFGAKYAQFYLQIHWANKITLVLLMIVLLAFIGAAAEVDASYSVFCAAVLAAVAFFTDYELDEKIKTKRLMLQMDFPDFLNKLTLLINAGMTIPKAWGKIVMDNKKQRPLYEELELVLSDIKSGKSENQAYEDFAKRCRTPEITKFISIIIQNLRKGNSELVSILRVQSNECWEMRKNVAKRLGEEASTKMLLPMMIMFAAILLIVAMPAIIALRDM